MSIRALSWMDPQTQLYLRYYSAQSGGALPTFSGARPGQYGAGLGDILRGLFRTILPIAAHGASTFLNETLRAKESGTAQSWGEAAKAALGSTAENVVTNSLNKLKQLLVDRQARVDIITHGVMSNRGMCWMKGQFPRTAIKGNGLLSIMQNEPLIRKLNFLIFNRLSKIQSLIQNGAK